MSPIHKMMAICWLQGGIIGLNIIYFPEIITILVMGYTGYSMHVSWNSIRDALEESQ